MRSISIFRAILSVMFLGFAIAFGAAYYVQYFKWRDCFNELGRCYDSETGMVYLEQSGMIWFSLCALSFGLSAYQIWRVQRQKS